MHFIFFLTTMLTIIFGANFYIFLRFWHLIPIFPSSRILLLLIAFFLTFSPFVSIGFGNRLPYSLSSILYQIGTSWLMIMLYLVIIFLVTDIIRTTGILPIRHFMFNSWLGFGVLSLLVTALMTFGNINYHHKKRVELTIKTGKNIVSVKPLKIVAISDLHLGYGIGTKEFQKWVKLINQEEADVVLIAGDAVDNRVKPMYDKDFAFIFSEIKAKQGVYLAPGNHEYIANIEESIIFLTKAGIIVLQDSVVLINNAYYIAGRDDRSNSKRKAIAEITAIIDQTKPIILLDHQPDHLDEVAENNIDLYFSGHTHDGQMWPISLITKTMYEVSYGYLKKGNTHFYVTSGIGIWGGKFRIGSRSEYVVINIE